MLTGGERFILGKNEVGGFGFSFGEITPAVDWGGEAGGNITERV